MDRSFRSSRFDKLIVESGRLLADASDHERALAELVERLTRQSPAVPLASPQDRMMDAPDARTVDGVVEGEPHDLVAHIRRLSAAAHQQRQRAEMLHAGLLGEPVYAGAQPIVLVVDDSKDSVETVALFLELSGFHVITAANGLEALIAAHYARPTVAVLDVAMPVMNGLEAARLLKASPITRNTRLMAYTANWSTDDSALKEVFSQVLAKPAGADEFLAAVRKLAAGGDAALN
jgi:CheY-like chemotaxis protein